MSDYSSCTQHPSTEAIGRCKQCGKPFCGACRIQGPTGYFCTPHCKEKHEEFIERAKQLDDVRTSRGFGQLFMRIRQLIVISIVVLIAAAVATYYGIYIPVLSDFLEQFM